jgi:hypothetical protein
LAADFLAAGFVAAGLRAAVLFTAIRSSPSRDPGLEPGRVR